MIPHRRPAVAGTMLAVAALALLPACTRDDDDASEPVPTPVTSAPTSTSATSVPTSSTPTSSTPTASTAGAPTTAATAPTTTGDTTTTAATTTVAAAATTTTAAGPTTTGPLTADGLVLRADGVGPITFGASYADVAARIGAVLGAPTLDETVEYPVPSDGRFAVDEFGDVVFDFPTGRTTCYANGFCISAGGPDAGALAFVGWSYSGLAAPDLKTPSGVTVDARWSDHPAIDVAEGGCFSEGTGLVDGIRVILVSEGEFFGEFDDDGNFVVGRPDPAEVIVVSLDTGTLPLFPFIDC